MTAESIVSVIIPTLVRDSLWEAVASVQQQAVRTELIIINDSDATIGSELVPPNSRIIDTGGKMGAAHARNLGMQAATGEFVAFLDDDDMWLPGHLKDAVSTLNARPEADLYSCRALVVREAASRIEPVELSDGRSISEYFFGKDVWRSRCRRILTPTLVFRRRLASVPMDANLHMSEDTWWLLTVEQTHGACMVQSASVGAVVYEASEREDFRLRQRRRDAVAWALKLEELVPGAGAAHLSSLQARVALRAGAPAEVIRLARAALGFDSGWQWLPAFTAQAIAACGCWVRRRLWGARAHDKAA